MQRKLFEDTGIHLSKASISYWLRGIHDPSGSLNRFHPDPSPELSYVIGVALSDGNINVHDYHREILLSVTDKDFASEFSRCLGRVLCRGEPYKVRWSKKRGRWIVQGSSILLHKFLNCSWFNLRKWIEHCAKCESAFLRAFYDGEGSICGKSLTIYNTNREMLLYIQDLLWHTDIETTQLHLNTKAGTRLIDSKNGRTYIRRKNCYALYVRARSLPRFTESIGFTIERKQERLLEAGRLA
jgi:intein-encoded DNA endonuclease-like protein